MSNVKLYKAGFDKEHGWQIDEVIGEVNGRILVRVNIGEKQYGDNCIPLQIEIYEDILQQLVDHKDDFKIIAGRKDFQTTIIYAGELLEFNEKKAKQYAILQTELEKKKYTFQKKVSVFSNLLMHELFRVDLTVETKEFMGLVNSSLHEEHLAVVFRHVLYQNINRRIQKNYNVTENKREIAEYLQSLSGQDLTELTTNILYIKTQSSIEGNDVEALANAFGTTEKIFMEQIEEEILNRVYRQQIVFK